MIQIRLLDHPSKFNKHEGMYTPCLDLEICDLCISKAEHIWHLSLPIMKYETYWYRYPIVCEVRITQVAARRRRKTCA